MRRSLPAVAGLLFCLAACLEPLDPSSVPVETVIVRIGANRSVDTIQVRHTSRVHAAAYSRDGYDIGLTSFTYTSSDEGIATVDANGTVQGVGPGTATITAKAPGGKGGTVTVVVEPTVIAYTLPAAQAPGAIAFSTDFTRAFVAVRPDSVILFDAYGFFRLGAVALDHLPHRLAATATRLYATHPDVDSVSIINTATGAKAGIISVGAGPTGAAAAGDLAFFAARFDKRIVIVNPAVTPNLGVPVNGEPHELAVSIDGKRLFASVENGGTWRIAIINPTFPDTIGSVAVAGRPTALATNGDGSRVYALVGNVVYAYASGGAGYTQVGTVNVGPNAGGISASPAGKPYVLVSGDEAVIFDGETLEVLERIPNAGVGFVGIRPDGLFGFISSPSANVVHVVTL